MDEQLQSFIAQHRQSAEAAGDAAIDALGRGDIGMARTASRQAAQYARIVMQLESGEKQVAPEDQKPEGAQTDSQANSVSV